MKQNICHAPFGKVLNLYITQSQIYETAVKADSSLIEQPHNNHCIAACYN